ncbi:MAG TPA: hypothetical protein VGU69_07570 [Rhizomicrobium sp.]|nr:hypothetical protein [Rhizomicrobium sp.]
MQKLPVGRIIRLAYAFTFGQIGTIIGLVWIPAVITAVMSFFAQGGVFTAILAGGQTGVAANGGPQVAFYLLSQLVSMLLFAVMAVAVAKQVFGMREGSPLVHFALGGQELRVFGGIAGLIVLTVMLLMAALAITGSVETVLERLIAPVAAALATGALIIAGFLAVLYFAIRLSFFFIPAAVIEGEFGISKSWQLSKGHFWQILVIGIAVLLPLLFTISVIETLIMGKPYLDLTAKMTNDLANVAKYQPDLMRIQQARLPFTVGLHLIITPIVVGLLVSPAAFAYRALTGKPQALPDA